MEPKNFLRSLNLIFLILVAQTVAQNGQYGLAGLVKDQLGGVIVGAEVTISKSGERLVRHTDLEGRYFFLNLKSGKYTIRVEKQGFAHFERTDVELVDYSQVFLNVILEIPTHLESVEISDEPERPNIAQNSNSDAIVLKDKELEALPDDPEALETALKLLAGPSAGPDGGEIFIDGFSSRNIPPKSSIREIRINRDPFSAEFERIGYGRIEILTRIGKTELGGSFFVRVNDEVLNARNPFAPTRAPFQSHRFGIDFSGRLLKTNGSLCRF
ncbi:MAG: carboxypeptidase-like regulatory domain-containing protein [Pyrinomonadaceae bacterium]